MTEPSVDEDFAAAQTGRGACKLSPGRALRLLEHARPTDEYIRSIEAFEVLSDGAEGLGLHTSMLGLSHAEADVTSPDQLNDLAASVFSDAIETGRNMLFSVWLAPRAEFDETGP